MFQCSKYLRIVPAVAVLACALITTGPVLAQEVSSESATLSFHGLENGDILVVDAQGRRELVKPGDVPPIPVVRRTGLEPFEMRFRMEVLQPREPAPRVRSQEETWEAIEGLHEEFFTPVTPVLPPSVVERMERGRAYVARRPNSPAGGPVAIPLHLLYPAGVRNGDLGPVAETLNQEIRRASTPILPPTVRERSEQTRQATVPRATSPLAGMPFAYQAPVPETIPLDGADRVLLQQAATALLEPVTPRLPESVAQRSERSSRYVVSRTDRASY